MRTLISRSPLRVRFVRDVLLTSGTQIAQAFAALIGGILIARTVGTTGRGTLSVFSALGSMAVLLTSLGLQGAGIYFLGRFKEHHDAIVSNAAVAAGMGGLITAAGLGAAGVLFHGALLHGISIGLFFVYLPWIVVNYFNEFSRRIALGFGKVGIFNVPEIAGTIGLSLGTGVTLLVFGSHLVPLVVLRVVTEAAASAALFLLLRRIVRFRWSPSWSVMRREIGYGLRNYASALLWVLLLQSDVVLCNHFLGTGPTGVYSVAVSSALPVTIVSSVVGALIFQRVAFDESRRSRIANTNRTVRVLVPCVLVPSLMIAALAHWIIPFLYGSQFSGATSALLLLMPGLLALSVETVLINFLAGEGSPPVVYVAPVIGLVVNVVANIFVIPRFGIDGAATTSTVAYGLVFAIVLGYYMRSTGSSLREILVAWPRPSARTRPPRAAGPPARSGFRDPAWAHRAFVAIAAVAIVAAGLSMSRGDWRIPAVVFGLAFVAVLGFVQQKVLFGALAVAALLQPPLANIGPFPQVTLAEILVPLLLGFLIVRRLTQPQSERRKSTPSLQALTPRTVRWIHTAIAVYAAVLAVNFFRSKFFLTTVIDAGVNRAFFDYAVALGVYLLFYLALTRGTFRLETLLRFVFGLSLVMSVIGVGAVALGLPLNLGELRYSIYDYASGGVRVGFLETFGMAGLALVIVGYGRHRLLTGALFAAALVASGGRGAAIGTVVAIALYLLITRRGLRLVAVAAIGIVVAVTVPSLQSAPQVQRLANINGQELQTDGRTVIWQQSLDAFLGQPLFGTGLGVPAVVFAPDPQVQQFYEAQLEVGGHATYPSLMKSFGLAGFLPFMVALLLALVGLARQARDRASPAAGFCFIVILAQAISMIASGNGSDPVYFLELAAGAGVLAGAEAVTADAAERAPALAPGARTAGARPATGPVSA